MKKQVWLSDEVSGGSLFSEYGYDELASAEQFANLYTVELQKYMKQYYPELEVVDIDIKGREESLVNPDCTTEDEDVPTEEIGKAMQQISDRIFSEHADDWAVSEKKIYVDMKDQTVKAWNDRTESWETASFEEHGILEADEDVIEEHLRDRSDVPIDIIFEG